METLCFPDELDKVRSMADHSSLCNFLLENYYDMCKDALELVVIPRLFLLAFLLKIPNVDS